jgi:hypothetical protein
MQFYIHIDWENRTIKKTYEEPKPLILIDKSVTILKVYSREKVPDGLSKYNGEEWKRIKSSGK